MAKKADVYKTVVIDVMQGAKYIDSGHLLRAEINLLQAILALQVEVRAVKKERKRIERRNLKKRVNRK